MKCQITLNAVWQLMKSLNIKPDFDSPEMDEAMRIDTLMRKEIAEKEALK